MISLNVVLFEPEKIHLYFVSRNDKQKLLG